MQRVAPYVDALALTPCFDVWEENGSARHGSTLACVYGGLVAAANLLEQPALLERAETVRRSVNDGVSKLGRFVKSSESDAVDSSLLCLRRRSESSIPTTRASRRRFA